MHNIELTDNHANSATAYPTVQLRIPTFWQGKALQNDVLKTAYHDIVSDIVTTSYLLTHPHIDHLS